MGGRAGTHGRAAATGATSLAQAHEPAKSSSSSFLASAPLPPRRPADAGHDRLRGPDAGAGQLAAAPGCGKGRTRRAVRGGGGRGTARPGCAASRCRAAALSHGARARQSSMPRGNCSSTTRSTAGRAGYDVVAPLKLAGSERFVLVDRGWVAQGPRRAELPAVPPPAGMQTVIGRVNLPPQRYLELATERGSGAVVAESRSGTHCRGDRPRCCCRFIVEQADPVAPADGLVRDWPAPDLGRRSESILHAAVVFVRGARARPLARPQLAPRDAA